MEASEFGHQNCNLQYDQRILYIAKITLFFKLLMLLKINLDEGKGNLHLHAQLNIRYPLLHMEQ